MNRSEAIKEIAYAGVRGVVIIEKDDQLPMELVPADSMSPTDAKRIHRHLIHCLLHHEHFSRRSNKMIDVQELTALQEGLRLFYMQYCEVDQEECTQQIIRIKRGFYRCMAKLFQLKEQVRQLAQPVAA